MTERQGAITLQGNPMTLIGGELKVGDKAPDFTALDTGLAPAGLKDFAGKVLVITSVPSLDTPVCDMETKRFNEEAGRLGAGVQILTLSMDLPFAQKRWCGDAGVKTVKTLSDHRDASFGHAYGLLIKELRLLARAVYVVDKEGVIRYAEIVGEVAHEPNYDAALEVVKSLL